VLHVDVFTSTLWLFYSKSRGHCRAKPPNMDDPPGGDIFSVTLQLASGVWGSPRLVHSQVRRLLLAVRNTPARGVCDTPLRLPTRREGGSLLSPPRFWPYGRFTRDRCLHMLMPSHRLTQRNSNALVVLAWRSRAVKLFPTQSIHMLVVLSSAQWCFSVLTHSVYTRTLDRGRCSGMDHATGKRQPAALTAANISMHTTRQRVHRTRAAGCPR
jgi:hypothetical protein